MAEIVDLNTAEGRAAARVLGFAVPPETDPTPPVPGKTHVLVFDGLLPRLNEVRGRHWSVENNAKKKLAKRLHALALQQHIPTATGPRSVFLDITLGPRRRKCDEDAYDKILLDALVRSGLLLNDSARGLVGRVGISFARGPTNETRICLTDVEAVV